MVNEEATSLVRAKALELGFTHFGVASAETLDPEANRLREWLNRGYHGSMRYMERNAETCSDVTRIVPGAKSVIAVAYNYYTPDSMPESPRIGKISRYAWGDDYHEVVTPKVRSLEAYLRELLPDSESRSYVDTGPVMDKAWAVRAGIGWLGKHTNVITRDLGSWVFLGEIITTAELAYDEPMEDFCGTCTACIEACPTQAITAPYMLDATRCISYRTIEARDEDISRDEDLDHDGWIYGCDVCQDVCPWNSFAVPTNDASFAPRPGNLEMELETVLSLEAEEYRTRFKNSPMKRAKLSGLKRNARIVLGGAESHTCKK